MNGALSRFGLGGFAPVLVKIPNLVGSGGNQGARVGAVWIETIWKGRDMLGKIIGAFAGRRIAGRNSGLKGALLGAGVGHLARRGLGPLAAGAAVAYGAKKLWDRRSRRSRHDYPSEATPASPSGAAAGRSM